MPKLPQVIANGIAKKQQHTLIVNFKGMTLTFNLDEETGKWVQQ